MHLGAWNPGPIKKNPAVSCENDNLRDTCRETCFRQPIIEAQSCTNCERVDVRSAHYCTRDKKGQQIKITPDANDGHSPFAGENLARKGDRNAMLPRWQLPVNQDVSCLPFRGGGEHARTFPATASGTQRVCSTSNETKRDRKAARHPDQQSQTP